MSKNLKKYSVLNRIAKKTKNKEVVDIILFGSAVKGKTHPEDIDVAIIFRNKIDSDLIRQFNKSCEKEKINAHISSLLIDNFFTKPHSLIKTMLFEGISLLTKKNIIENYGLSSWSIYNYTLTNMKKSERVRFVYLLKGRGKENGLIKELKGKFLAPSCFIIPVEKDQEILEVLDKWKVKFERKKVLLMD